MDEQLKLDVSKDTTVRDYLRVIFKYKAVIFITITIIMSIVLIDREIRVQNKYIASVKMLLFGATETEEVFYRKSIQPRALVQINAEILKTKTIVERVVKTLNLDQRPIDEEMQSMSRIQAALASNRINNLKAKVEEMDVEERKAFLFNLAVERLQSNIRMEYDVGIPVFKINVIDVNPDAAVVIANSVSRSLIIYNIEQQIAELKLKYGDKHSTIAQLQNYVEELYETLDGKLLPDLKALGPGSIKIIEQARSSSYIGGKSNSKAIIGFLGSIFLGVLLAFVFDVIDQSFKLPQDIEKFLDIPLIGSIPREKSKNKLLVGEGNPANSDYIRSFQNLSEQIYLMMKDEKIKTLLIADIEAPKGDVDDANNITANLGSYLSRKGGYKILIIDADLRNPSMSKIFNIPDSPGLLEVLKEEIAFEAAVHDMGSNLNVLSTSKLTSNPIAFLDSSMMSNLINAVGKVYDLVFFTCPDIKNFSDAIVLSSKTDGAALIVNEGKINRQVAKCLISPMQQEKINIIGAIFNNRSYVIPNIIYKLT